jgi:AraC family transcriptional regulator of adaptative response / DNA-3-methyladenine glycosylase II
MLLQKTGKETMVAISPLATFEGLHEHDRLAFLRQHREAFMGRVLIGVLTTGIYCLPSCTAREPKPENVRFFRTQEEAQAAGLRPCKRCHPDYFYRDYDPDRESLLRLVAAVRTNPHNFTDADAMVADSGIGLTKLHELFRQHYHTTPVAFLNRARLNAALTQLTHADRSVADVAFGVGYESVSAFHDNFRKATGLTPGEYRDLGKTDHFTIRLPKYYLGWIPMKLLGRDPESVIERVEGNTVIKALTVGNKAVLLRMKWDADAIYCQTETRLDAAEMRAVHNAVLRMLGLGNSPTPFERQVNANPEHSRLIAGREGLHIPLYTDIFEGVIWSIVGQQVNLAFAYKLRHRLAELCGQRAGDGWITNPTPEAVARLDYSDLTPLQFSQRKAEYLIDTARLIVAGKLKIDPLAPATQTKKDLLNVRGLGQWSVNYLMMRSLGFGDCVPLGDTGLSTGLQRFFGLDHRPDAEETDRLMLNFAPYRSYASYHLWLSLGGNPV